MKLTIEHDFNRGFSFYSGAFLKFFYKLKDG